MLIRLARFIGVDRAIFYSVLNRLWIVSSGLLTVIFILESLTEQEQGYYFTFGGLLGLKIIFDFGCSQVVVRFSSYEMGQVVWGRDPAPRGDQASIQRLSSLLHKFARWYGVISVLFALVLIPLGLAFFSAVEEGVDASYWLVPWVMTVLIVSLNLFLSPLLGFLQGCGHVVSMEQARLVTSIVAAFSLWVSLALDGGLYALVISELVSFIVILMVLYRRHYVGLVSIWHARSAENYLDWSRDVWPFQWRVAVSFLFEYFCAKAFIPVAFYYFGAVEAGKLGLSLIIMDHVAATASAWFTTRNPKFGVLVNQGRWEELDGLFKITLFQSLMVLLLGSVGLWFVIYGFHYYEIAYAHRLLDLYGICLLILIRIAMLFIVAMYSYMHSHREQPFFVVSIAHGMFAFVLALICAAWYGVDEMLLSRLFVTIGVVFASYRVFIRRRKVLHQETD